MKNELPITHYPLPITRQVKNDPLADCSKVFAALPPDVRQVSDLPLACLLLADCSNVFAALPPDVRQVFDLPFGLEAFMGLRPERLGRSPQNIRRSISEGHRPSAHRTAEPRRINGAISFLGRSRFHFGLPVLLSLLIVFALPAFAQRAKSTQPSKPATPAAQAPAFEKISAQANQQREAGNFDEAIKLYQQGVAAKPRWEEGWWYLATLLYEQDRYEEAVKAFSRVAALQPKVGAPVAMQGLCEYRLGRYDDAFLHLQQGRQRGIGDNQDLARIMRFHEATLFLLRGDFETAQRVFTGLATEGSNTQDLMIGLGLSILRISALPKQIGLTHRDRELIRRAGLAQHYHAQLNAADSRIEFERLVKDFPTTPNVQYAYGRFLIDTRDDDTAIAAFEKEIANSPSHALARLQIAYIKLRNKDPEAGIKLAEEAVRLTPRLPLGHYVLGRCLFETGENKRAIEELEIAQRMAPSEARVYYVLARAYSKANRKEDAERARETFARLNKASEDAAQRGDQRGDAIEEKEAAEKIKP